MNISLNPVEVRVLGCLLEKQVTTPDAYPLTLNSLLIACNQKSNREPIMHCDEASVMGAVQGLLDKTLATFFRAGHSRAAKYSHRLHERVFDEFNFSKQQRAILCVLFLRGPQTLGEIRIRCARSHDFADLAAVTTVLKELEDNPNGPYVQLLPRYAGQKEARYNHLFCGEIEEYAQAIIDTSPGNIEAIHPQILALEEKVSELSQTVESLERRFNNFIKQFD